MIEESLLEKYGAEKILIEKGDFLFKKDGHANFFYQVASGEIKMNNFNDDGKEFIQGIFKKGRSFGEPPLFSDRIYPANAEALVDSYVWKLSKDAFFDLLFSNPKVHMEVTSTLAKRLHYKSMVLSEIASQDPEHRILKVIDYFKIHIDKTPKDELYKVKMSRQQIADLTGLRVETVIRAIKTLEKKGLVTIENRKVFR
ncbi:Crp/Fnr family transcriptional regulator [Aureivirga sp. CE67]|uniref:Crp/Fnr family transcriptional regulator n=1 Tax=Aureivirga sp. CE67 TaxID=1788983 RepID=UPI0018C90C12|nr:Crp/Fnr family transcriptional regulator [Aureivirga sp. CE67]